jgi:hypothetical protein
MISTVRLSRFAAQPCAGIHTSTEKLLSGCHEIRRWTPLADPEVAADKLIELANAFEPFLDSRIYIEKFNAPSPCQLKGTLAEYKAGLDLAIAKGWLWLHESGTYLRFTMRARHFS